MKKKKKGAMTPRGCLICAPLVARSVSQMLTQMQEAKANGADVVESRVDHIPGFNAAKDLPVLLNARTLPMIVTARFALDFSKSVTNFFLFLVLHHQTSACFQGRSTHRFCFSLSLSLSLSRCQIRSNHSSPVEVSLHKLQPSLCQNFSFQLHLT